MRDRAAQGALRTAVLVGESPPIRALRAVIRSLADFPATVLITGEPGVGKTLVARALHQQSTRRDQPYVEVDCAVVPASQAARRLFGHAPGAGPPGVGLIEQAHTGTLVLDGVEHLPGQVQVLLVQMLEEQAIERLGGGQRSAVDVRLIAVTTHDPHRLVGAGTLRADLHYRLTMVPIEVPPLRTYGADLPLLVQHIAQTHGLTPDVPLPGFTPAALAVLERYPWPGNVRELAYVVRCLLARAGPRRWDVTDLPLALCVV